MAQIPSVIISYAFNFEDQETGVFMDGVEVARYRRLLSPLEVCSINEAFGQPYDVETLVFKKSPAWSIVRKSKVAR